jgi:dihydrofolate reductase
MKLLPRICIIAALGRNRVIGSGGKIPWHLPDDLRRFKRLTLGHAVIMGRKTFDSVIATVGTPLPGRDNIVVTRSRDWSHPGCQAVRSLDAALAATQGLPDAFVIGGAEIYALALPLAQRLHLTEIGRDFDGDAFFPELERSEWREVSRERRAMEEPGGFRYAFVEYERDG